jgi:hypothetical protein
MFGTTPTEDHLEEALKALSNSYLFTAVGGTPGQFEDALESERQRISELATTLMAEGGEKAVMRVRKHVGKWTWSLGIDKVGRGGVNAFSATVDSLLGLPPGLRAPS